VFDFATAQRVAEEARELGRSADWLPPVVSAGLDLLLKFTRCGEVALAESLLDEVARGVERGPGAHGWLWNLRFAQVQADLALARGRWQEALRWADSTLQQSRTTRRVKYEITGLLSQAQALTSLDRKKEAISDVTKAVELARPLGDPMLFLHAAAALLELDGNDDLAGEARAAARSVAAALPDERMRRAFEAASPVRWLSS
jgi:tetratricopeptide (TPR) repeat protein